MEERAVSMPPAVRQSTETTKRCGRNPQLDDVGLRQQLFPATAPPAPCQRAIFARPWPTHLASPCSQRFRVMRPCGTVNPRTCVVWRRRMKPVRHEKTRTLADRVATPLPPSWRIRGGGSGRSAAARTWRLPVVNMPTRADGANHQHAGSLQPNVQGRLRQEGLRGSSWAVGERHRAQWPASSLAHRRVAHSRPSPVGHELRPLRSQPSPISIRASTTGRTPASCTAGRFYKSRLTEDHRLQ